MAERYIRRATLPAQQFGLACPVTLMAGALLEDTHQPRLVGQLKWLAPKGVVTALSILLHCQGVEPQTLAFHYPAPRSIPGCPFGQYTAIPLPAGTVAFQVEVVEVTFQSGEVWSREAEQAKAQTLQAAAEQAAAERAAQKAQALQAKTKGKVEAPEQPSPTAKKPVRDKALAAVAVAGIAVILAAVVLLPKLGGKPAQTPPADEDLPAAADDSTGAAADGARDEASPTPQSATPTPSATLSPVFSSMDLGETGEVAEVYIHRDQSGYFSLTPDAFVDDVPNATTTCAWMGKDLGGDVIAYLKDSFSFAWYVTQDSPNYGMSGDGTMYPAEDGIPPALCVLALSGEGSGKLVGYFIGQPIEVDQDTIRIDLTLCDFALAPLYEQERDAFLAGADLLDVERVAPDTDFEALGVEYCLPGFHTSETDHLTQSDCQYYHLWQALTSPDPRRYARSVESLRTHMDQSGSQQRYQFHLLLDQDCQPIAYTWQK